MAGGQGRAGSTAPVRTDTDSRQAPAAAGGSGGTLGSRLPQPRSRCRPSQRSPTLGKAGAQRCSSWRLGWGKLYSHRCKGRSCSAGLGDCSSWAWPCPLGARLPPPTLRPARQHQLLCSAPRAGHPGHAAQDGHRREAAVCAQWARLLHPVCLCRRPPPRCPSVPPHLPPLHLARASAPCWERFRTPFPALEPG